MPLDPAEAVALSTEALALLAKLADALRKDEEGKVRVTREEGRELGKAALKLGQHLLRDFAD
jgi:hypothetical protein